METLWSMSTTVREGERIVGFLKTALELDGQEWNKETQVKFQILLIKNRQYLNDPNNSQSFNKLNAKQEALLRDVNAEITFDEAREIFEAKDYNDPPMRGRQSLAPLQKLGLVYIVGDKGQGKLKITDVGKKLASGDIDFGDFMLDSLLKFQYPNPREQGFQTWKTKPFVNTLRLIKQVDELCETRGIKVKGISFLEFGIFALSLRSYHDVEKVAEQLLSFREQDDKYKNDEEREKFRTQYINDYLIDFKNPVKNVREYTDNMVRYLRLTKYVYIRGKYSNAYIDLEPRRKTEIDSILEHDNGCPQDFTDSEWIEYMGNFGTYELPFETIQKLTEILSSINLEITELEHELFLTQSVSNVPTSREELKLEIQRRRVYRTSLQNATIKKQYREDICKIDEAVESLRDLRQRNKSKSGKKFSIELEKWANVALNILDDSILIKPNYPVGDDAEPIYTAPSGIPDIECYYSSFGAVCEVTMLTGRDQWFNEGQPVMRHLRQFEDLNTDKPNYCLFVAPSIHVDTLNTFYNSVKYEYEGKKQKIIPITILQLERLLNVVKNSIKKELNFTHNDLKKFYDKCTNFSRIKKSTDWTSHIETELVRLETQFGV